MVNIAEVMATREEIGKPGSGWDQGSWRTCFAGLTVKRHGYDVLRMSHDEIERKAAEILDFTVRTCESCSDPACSTANSFGLFSVGNYLPEIDRIIERIRAEEGEAANA